MKTCGYCGRQNGEEATHCSGCGTELSTVADGWEPMVDAEASDWILRTFRWALDQFGADYFFGRTILVTPTRDHFPEQPKDPRERAAALFSRVQGFAGLQNWPCQLVAQEPDVNPVVDAVTVLQNAPQSPAGTFVVTGNEQAGVEITYNPAQIERPQALVATFAHELAHYLGHTAKSPPPGGEKNREYATDLLAVFMGFGLFLANSAVSFNQFTGVNSQGWSTRTLGYLSEFELVYCLAVFCELKDLGREQVKPHLKEWLLPVYDDALKDLATKAGVLAEMKRRDSAPQQSRTS